MQCLDENSVAAFFERQLPAHAVEQIDEHVGVCVGCRDLLAVFARLYPAANDTPPPVAFAPTTPAENGAGNDELASGDAAIARHLAVAQARRRIGSVLAGRWTLQDVLGVGGMGQVFAATHRNGKRAAIKVLRPELSGAPSVVRRFVQEGYAANRVGHPRAVSVLDDGVAEDGAIFLVMDLLEGETLKARIAHGGPMPVADVLHYAREVLGVLASAHARGIVHRDIKPENLFLTKDGAIHVLDFGIARVRELSCEQGATESGLAMGTPAFMPPEQARGQTARVDARADLWALGATMFVLLTGDPVRNAGTAREELFLAMTAKARSIVTALPNVPSRVAVLVNRALAFEPDDRWPDALAMQRAVEEAMLGVPVARVGKRRRRVEVALGACAIATLSLVFVVRGAAYSGSTASAPSTSSASSLAAVVVSPTAVAATQPAIAAVATPPAPAKATAPRVDRRGAPHTRPEMTPSPSSSQRVSAPPPVATAPSEERGDPLDRHY